MTHTCLVGQAGDASLTVRLHRTLTNGAGHELSFFGRIRFAGSIVRRFEAKGRDTVITPALRPAGEQDPRPVGPPEHGAGPGLRSGAVDVDGAVAGQRRSSAGAPTLSDTSPQRWDCRRPTRPRSAASPKTTTIRIHSGSGRTVERPARSVLAVGGVSCRWSR